jgi:hypothetical protein
MPQLSQGALCRDKAGARHGDWYVVAQVSSFAMSERVVLPTIEMIARVHPARAIRVGGGVGGPGMRPMDRETAELKAKLDQLRGLDDRDYAIWQFFESRADQIKMQLWTTSTWLIALQGGLLAFTFGDRMSTVNADGTIVPKIPLLVTLFSGLGLALSVLTLAVVLDAARHIRSNWARASAAKGDYHAILRSSRIHTLPPIIVVDALFACGFAYLLWTALVRSDSVTSIVLVAAAIAGPGFVCALAYRNPERPEPEARPQDRERAP